MSQWYLSYDGNQIGPFDKAQAIAKAKENPNGFAWREGYAEWLPIIQIAELSSSRGAAPSPPPLTAGGADEIDFKIQDHCCRGAFGPVFCRGQLRLHSSSRAQRPGKGRHRRRGPE